MTRSRYPDDYDKFDPNNIEYDRATGANKLRVVKISPVTGTPNEMLLELTPYELEAYDNGMGHVQDMFPHLDSDEREFLISGMTPADWEAVVGVDDDPC